MGFLAARPSQRWVAGDCDTTLPRFSPLGHLCHQRASCAQVTSLRLLGPKSTSLVSHHVSPVVMLSGLHICFLSPSLHLFSSLISHHFSSNPFMWLRCSSSLPVQWGFSILSQEVSALVTSMAVSGSFSVHLPSLSFVSPREFPNPFMCLSYWNRRVEFFSVCASTHLSPGSDIPILPCISISFSGGVHIVSQGLFPNKFIYLPYWVVWFFLLPAFPFVYNQVFGGRRKLLSRWWC